MDLTMTLALSLVGSGAMVAGAIGLFLPMGERLAAALALVIGAGVGVMVLSVGLLLVGEGSDSRSYERVFLVASAVGFAAVVASAALLWRRTRA